MEWIQVSKIWRCVEICFDDDRKLIDENECKLCKSRRNHIHYDSNDSFTIEIFENHLVTSGFLTSYHTPAMVTE